MPSGKIKPRKPRQKSAHDKRFLELARKHLAEDFPNPTRQGCPSNDALRKLAFAPKEAEEKVLHHVGFCSPCYKVFARFLRQVKEKDSRKKTSPSAAKRKAREK